MNEPIVIAHSQQGSIHTVAVPWEKDYLILGIKRVWINYLQLIMKK